MSQSNDDLFLRDLLCLTATLADTRSNFFHLPPLSFVMACVPRTVAIRSYLTHWQLTSQLVLARSAAAL